MIRAVTRTAALYCRISRDKEGAGLGVERQEAECRELAGRLDWTVAEVYVDNDLSASTGKPRPAYRRMLDDLRDGRIGAVIAWHSDRLHRRPTELEEFIEVCETRGVAVQTVRAGTVDLSTASGRMVARMLGAAARHEAEHSSERIRAQKARAAASGQWIGGGRPFGYNQDGATLRVDEAERVADAAVRILAGETTYKIAKEWRETGVATPRGGTWNEVNLRRILISPRVAGLLEHRGAVVAPAPWPAIVPEDQWRVLRAKLTAPERATFEGARTLRWIGSGLYLCGICSDGSVLRSAGRPSTGRNSGYAVYRCRTGLHCTIRADTLDDYVHRLVRERLSRPDAGDLLPAAGTDRAAELRAEADALRARLDEAADMFASGEIDRRGHTRARERITARLDVVTTDLGRLAGTSPLGGLVDADDPAAAYDAAPIDRRRAVVDALMSVTVGPARPGRLPKGQPFDYSRVTVAWKAEPVPANVETARAG